MRLSRAHDFNAVLRKYLSKYPEDGSAMQQILGKASINQFNKPIFNLWDSVLPNYIKEGVITGEVTTDPWIDVGTHERLKLANSVYNDD